MGPRLGLFARRVHPDADRSHATTKLERIAEVLELQPWLSFVLIGDSGQQDAEIYAEVVRRRNDRVRGIS